MKITLYKEIPCKKFQGNDKEPKIKSWEMNKYGAEILEYKCATSGESITDTLTIYLS